MDYCFIDSNRCIIMVLPIIKLSFITWGGDVKLTPRGVMKEESGASFFLPDNWEYTAELGPLYITITLKCINEPLLFVIRWEPPSISQRTESSETLANTLAETSKEKQRTTGVSRVSFNGFVGYKYATILKVDGNNYYQAFLCFKICDQTDKERVIIFEKIAPSINALKTAVFKQIENSFDYIIPKSSPFCIFEERIHQPFIFHKENSIQQIPIASSIQDSYYDSFDLTEVYDEGYDDGYEQGYLDGRGGYYYEFGYDDFSYYYDDFEETYQNGYRDGYEDGYYDGRLEYEWEIESVEEDDDWW